MQNAQQYQRIKEIFQAAQALDVASRESFIASACDGETGLKAEVEHLLRADASSGRFLEMPVVDANLALDRAAGDEILPERIGRYRIVRLLGEGGMGSVYEAEQDSPKRRVALKVLRAGTMQPRMLQRFQREVEVLGRLQHPGIARIYDAGVAEVARGDGRTARVPYFAMELIKGNPITTFANERGLSIRNRLTLLAEVCDAVHYGHQHGIVHRDLKPGNVLVGHSSVEAVRPSRPDGTPPSMPAPKIIDFGVARVTNADLALTTLATDAGQLIGTLAYMSPEQVQGNPAEIDARSDIYALGVIGYELLTDRLPYAVADKIAPEAARIIRDEEPSRMSSISRVFRGDIETIFAKALEKEPARRYDSAAALAADIRRYLSDEPIIARPPTLGYQLAKFARRHKEFVAGLALVFIVLIAGMVATSLALVQALQQKKAATIAKTDALTAATTAKIEAERAQGESRKSQRISEMMQRILSFATPGTPGGGRDVKVVEMLDNAADELLGQLADAPDIEMTLRRTLGQTYARLGLDETAQRHYRRALELTVQIYGRDTLEVSDLFAEMVLAKHWTAGTGDELSIRALAMAMEQQITMARGKAPSEHPTMQRLLFASGRINTRAWRADSAIASLTELLTIMRTLPKDRQVFSELEVTAALVNPLVSTLRFEQAEASARAVLAAIADAPPEIAFDVQVSTLSLLGLLMENQQRLDGAAVLYGEAFTLQRETLGLDHPNTRATVHSLRSLMLRMRRLEEALAFNTLERDALERTQPSAEWLAYLQSYEGSILARLGRTQEARPWFEQAIARRRAVHGDDKMIQEWWRAGVASVAMLYEPWSSESVRRYLVQHLERVLSANPTTSFDFDEIQWRRARFRIERWNGSEAIEIEEGPFERLRELSDPEPGLYRLIVRCPRVGTDDVVLGDWFLAAQWTLDLFRAFRMAEAPDSDVAVTIGPHEQRQLAALMFAERYTDPLGPAGAQMSFGIDASAHVQLPAGKYRLQVYVDDGARIWLDDQLIIDAYWQARQHSSAYSVDVEFTDEPREMRVQYFQHGEAAILWITAEPMPAGAPNVAD